MRAVLMWMMLLLPALALAEDAPEFGSLYLVLLKAGPNAEKLTDEKLQEIQTQHLAHLRKLSEAGTIMVAGPFDEQDDDGMRGMCLYRTASKEEAKKLAEEDPAVKAGRLEVEIQRWWFHTERVAFPMAPTDGEETETKAD